MNLDAFRDHLAAELAAQVTVLRNIERHVAEIRESQEELQRLVGDQVRELRARLNGRDDRS